MKASLPRYRGLLSLYTLFLMVRSKPKEPQDQQSSSSGLDLGPGKTSIAHLASFQGRMAFSLGLVLWASVLYTAWEGVSTWQHQRRELLAGVHPTVGNADMPGAHVSDHQESPLISESNVTVPPEKLAVPTLLKSSRRARPRGRQRHGASLPKPSGTSPLRGTASPCDNPPLIKALASEILSYWERSYPSITNRSVGNNQTSGELDSLPQNPRPPHLEDCSRIERIQKEQDEVQSNGSWPHWAELAGEVSTGDNITGAGSEKPSSGSKGEGPWYPPWVVGGDGENLPLTRRAQRDIWAHQHPKDCSDPSLRFFVISLYRDTLSDSVKLRKVKYLGVGAQLGVLAGALSHAMSMNRILVIGEYGRATSERCQGADAYVQWSCYYAPETSEQCRRRALQIMAGEASMRRRKSVPHATLKAYVWGRKSFRPFYRARAPERWGAPWEVMQASVLWQGELIGRTRKDSYRWFLAQAMRYFMRYPSPGLCQATNAVRHAAFGREAALASAEALMAAGERRVPSSEKLNTLLSPLWEQQALFQGTGKLISVHVRQGDKGSEMVIHKFAEHMRLAALVRVRFPEAKSIWLITEMQPVVDKTRLYPRWKFYYTRVPRQRNSLSMRQYELQMSVPEATEHAFANMRIAEGADFFVGTMGSTYSVIIDGLRRTGGKESRGMLTVNKDRAWMSWNQRSKLGLER